MANSQFAGEGVKVLLTESLSNQPHFGVNVDVLAIGGGNTGALLAPVLEGIQPEKG
jgi:peptidase E